MICFMSHASNCVLPYGVNDDTDNAKVSNLLFVVMDFQTRQSALREKLRNIFKFKSFV